MNIDGSIVQCSEVLLWPVYMKAVYTGLKREAGKSNSTAHTCPDVFSLIKKHYYKSL
jgi:hypothetical protein